MYSDSLFVVLGWAPSAAPVVERLLCFGRRVVLVDLAPPAGIPGDVHFVQGAPRDGEALKRAGVERAAAVLSCLPPAEADAALAEARRLNPGVRLASVADAEPAR